MAKQLCLIEFTNIKQMVFCKLIMSFLNKNLKKKTFILNHTSIPFDEPDNLVENYFA